MQINNYRHKKLTILLIIQEFSVILQIQSKQMKPTIKKIISILVMTMFLVYSSGLVITVHHCCHKHHHEANDHRHCTENTYIFKITDQFNSSTKQDVKPIITSPILLPDILLYRCTLVAQNPIKSFDYCHCLFHQGNTDIFNLVAHWLL